MPVRGLSFKKDETLSLLDLVEELLPVSPQEWDEVTNLHLQNWPDLERSKDTLKRRFQSLYLKRAPTGDPSIPVEVRRAKQIIQEIKKRADLSDGEEESVAQQKPTARSTSDEDFVAPTATEEDDEENQEQMDSEEYIQQSTAKGSDNSVAASISTNSKKKSVFSKPMIRVGSKSHDNNEFSSFMMFMMKKTELEMKDRENEREARRVEEEHKRKEEFMKLQIMQQQTNAILMHLASVKSDASISTYLKTTLPDTVGLGAIPGTIGTIDTTISTPTFKSTENDSKNVHQKSTITLLHSTMATLLLLLHLHLEKSNVHQL